MKKIIYLSILSILILSCDKMIDIEYNTNVKDSAPDLIWKGTWDGTLTSLDRKHKYGYTLTITEYKKKSIKGVLKISKLPEKTDYIFYNKLDIESVYGSKFLKIKTSSNFEKKGDISFCNENTFNLELLEDKKSLTGFGKSQENCLITDSTIKLEKK